MSITDNERDIEAQIQHLRLDAPRLNPQHIETLALSAEIEYHVFHGTQTVCSLCLPNGFTVIGQSAPVSPENFNEAIGQRAAWQNARDKLWELEGYLLRVILDARENDEEEQ